MSWESGARLGLQVLAELREAPREDRAAWSAGESAWDPVEIHLFQMPVICWDPGEVPQGSLAHPTPLSLQSHS